MNFLIDYLTFSLRPTSESKEIIHIEDIASVLGIKQYLPDFYAEDKGHARFYDHCYSYNGISIYTTDYERGVSFCSDSWVKYKHQGICFEIKGAGCSFLEHRPDRTLFSKIYGEMGVWKSLFSFLIAASRDYGYKINISRIDFAFDDICLIDEVSLPKLSLDDIAAASLSSDETFNHVLCVSSSRSKRDIIEHCKIKRYDNSLKAFINTPALGRTIYFGSKQSDCYCRFYDKLVEQSVLRAKEPLYLRDTLGKLSHWVRFEIVFRNKPALSIMLAYLSKSELEFSSFLAKTINSYIRFVCNDDTNISRCTVCLWWSEFIGIAEHARIKKHGIVRNEFNRAVHWISSQVSTTANAIIDNQGIDFFLELILNSCAEYKPKHERIAKCKDYTEPLYLSYDELMALKPIN